MWQKGLFHCERRYNQSRNAVKTSLQFEVSHGRRSKSLRDGDQVEAQQKGGWINLSTTGVPPALGPHAGKAETECEWAGVSRRKNTTMHNTINPRMKGEAVRTRRQGGVNQSCRQMVAACDGRYGGAWQAVRTRRDGWSRHVRPTSQHLNRPRDFSIVCPLPNHHTGS